MPIDGSVEILLVEDNRDDAELVSLAFSHYHLGNRIGVVTDGKEALEYLLSTGRYARRRSHPPPKVILLDIKLPLIDGMEVLRRIKTDPRTAMTPVVLLTSSNVESDIRRGYALGANSYVVKPVDFEQFRNDIREIGMYWLLLNKSPSGSARCP